MSGVCAFWYTIFLECGIVVVGGERELKQIFDLHIHTKCSDGELSVEELIAEIRKYGIEFFSITDHDTTAALEEIEKNDIGDLKFIRGIEFSSILDQKYKMHILGYNIDANCKDIIDATKTLKKARSDRFCEMASALLEKYNFQFEEERLNEVIKTVNIPGKPHLAKLMVEKGYVESVAEAFEKYLNDIKTTISNRIDAKTAINAIKKSDGIAIWAHPKKVEKQYNIDFEEILPRLLDLGLDGIEIYNSLHSLADCKRYENTARSRNLITSGGSDFHGIRTKPNVKLGEVFNSGEEYKINVDDISVLSLLK